MKIRLLVIGTRPEDWVRDAVSLYLARLPAHLKPELVEIPLSLRSSGGDPEVAAVANGGGPVAGALLLVREDAR